MRMIIMDLEMNQPSGTIIQIGACVIDTQKKGVDSKFDSVCNPGELPSEFITGLTGITRSDVQNAPPIHDVLTSFWDWAREVKAGKRMGAWGKDIPILQRASALYKIRYVWPKQYDIKQYVNLHIHFHKREKLGMGLEKCLELYGIEFEGKQHNAYCDAYNTALLLNKVIEEIK